MDSSVNLIEVLSDGKYRLNEHEMQSIVSKAEECNDFAVISIIGAKYSGKSLFMNSLVKYLECKDKNNWPKDCFIEYKKGFNNSPRSIPVIQMWSKPFILEADGHKTAVFLIDTSHVIETYNDFESTKLGEDLIGLLFTTSSTVVYNQLNLLTGMPALIELSKNVLKIVENCDSFQQLFYLIQSWDLTLDMEGKDYSFGVKDGQRYVEEYSEYSELNKYFKDINCCLLPPAGRQIHMLNVVFNDLNKEFLVHFSQLIKYRLLNIDEMQVKKHPVSQRALRPQELVVLLRSYVNKLNGDSVSIDFGLSDEINDSKEPINEKFNTCLISSQNCFSQLYPNLEEIENKLTERHQQTIEAMNITKKITEDILKTKITSNQTVFGRSQATNPYFISPQFMTGQTYSSQSDTSEVGVQTNDENTSEESDKMDTNENESNEWSPTQTHNQNSTEITNASDVSPQTYSSNKQLICNQNKESEAVVNKLNGDSLSIDFEVIDETIVSIEKLNEKVVNESSESMTNSLEMNSLSPQILQNLLREKQKQFNEYTNAMKKTTEEILEINKALINDNSNHGHSDEIQFETIENQSDEQSIDISDESTDASVNGDNADNDPAEHKYMQGETITKEMKESNENLSDVVFVKYCEIKCEEYVNEIRVRINENDVNLEKASILRTNIKIKFLKQIDVNFRTKMYKSMRKEFKEKLSQMIDSLEPQLVSETQQLLTQINENYDKCLQQLLDRYEHRIKKDFEEEYEWDFKPDLNQVYNKLKNYILREYENSVKQMNKTNKFVTESHLKSLETGLTLRENKYKKVAKVIENYLKEWKTITKTDQFFDDEVLSEKHEIFKQNAMKSDSQELTSFLMQIIERVFKRIENQNTINRNKERQLIEDFMIPLINKFWTQFSDRLKSGFYNQIDMKLMFEKDFNFTKQSIEKNLKLKGSQQKLVNDLKQRLDSEIREDFKKISSDYSQKTAEAKNRIENAQDEAIDLYRDLMIEGLAQKTIKTQEIDAISSDNKVEAFKLNERRLESIKSYFNKDFFDFVVNENKGKIAEKIEKHEKNFFKNQEFIYSESGTTQTLTNTSFAIHFSRYNLFAAIYDTEFRPVLDNYNNIYRPNCIAFSDETLFGYEAKNYIQSLGIETLNPFNDIKNLLFKKKSDLKVEKINSYPFEFSDNNNVLKVKIQNKFSYDLSIEAMIALQVLDIKSDAEKQFGSSITRAVFTVPTYYSIKQRNAFKDVATIAGLESVHVLSEITAAAIGYSNQFKPQTEIKVLFVAINDYECDAAVVRLKVNQIEYLSYFDEIFLEYKKKSWNSSLPIWAFNKNDPKEGEKMRKSLSELLDKVFCNVKINKNQIKDIVLIGDSNISDELKTSLSNYFKDEEVIDCTSGKRHNIVAEGSAIFCKSINGSNADLSFDITEVVFHSLEYYIKEQRITYGPKSLISSNTKLNNTKITLSLQRLSSNDLPICICIYKDKLLIAQFQINRLPSDFSTYSFKTYEIYFNFNNLGEISLSSHLIRNKSGSVPLNVVPISLGLSQNDLISDKEFIEKFDKQSKKSRIESERKSMFEKLKKELSDKYIEIKKRVESTELGRLEKIEEQLKKTEVLLFTTDIELKTITNQISILEKLKKKLVYN